jgi:hypothetical protein
MSLPRQLHAASLPFVTRALRGGRKLRYAGVAVLLVLLSVMLGAWLALGSGRLEHELRVGFRLERPMYQQEQLEFKVFAEDEDDLADLRAAVLDLTTGRMTQYRVYEPENYAHARVSERLHEGVRALAHARNSNMRRLDPASYEAAGALARRHGIASDEMDSEWYGWDEAEAREQLQHVIARDLRPEVALYSSPLSTVDAVRVIGLVAGSMAMMLLMLFAPVLAGTQMAQEVHENTLQPLTGTALSARDLVLGMTLGPAAVIALLAGPQIALFLAAALAVGNILPALGMLAVCVAAGAFLTMLAQLAGLALGRQRSSGMLGVALLAVLAPLTFLGALFAIEMPGRALGMMALLPQAAASHMLMESFVPAGSALRGVYLNDGQIAAAQLAVVIGAVGMLCFAFLGLRALERRVGELSPTALTRGEALFGALVSTVLITLANPFNHSASRAFEFYLINFGIVLVPMAILLMMRVPMAETPTALRRIPLVGLLAEFTAGIALFFAVCIGCMGLAKFDVLESPIALLYLLWMIGVAALLAIRVAALPMSLLAKIWAGVCAIGLGVGFVHLVEWTRRPGQDLSEALGFWQVSPVLGLLQGLMLVLIPVLLVRALRHPASTTPTEA